MELVGLLCLIGGICVLLALILRRPKRDPFAKWHDRHWDDWSKH